VIRLARLAQRIHAAMGLWRLEGYDGKPNRWALAWEIAGCWYGPAAERIEHEMEKMLRGGSP
jgi:hypothetical protein